MECCASEACTVILGSVEHRALNARMHVCLYETASKMRLDSRLMRFSAYLTCLVRSMLRRFGVGGGECCALSGSKHSGTNDAVSSSVCCSVVAAVSTGSQGAHDVSRSATSPLSALCWAGGLLDAPEHGDSADILDDVSVASPSLVATTTWLAAVAVGCWVSNAGTPSTPL